MTSRKGLIPGQVSGALTRGGALPAYLNQQGAFYVIDPARLPIPPNSYDANVAWTERENLSLSIFFARRHRDQPDELKSRVQLLFSIDDYYNFFFNSKDFRDNLSAYLKDLRKQDLLGPVRDQDAAEAASLKAAKELTATATIGIVTQTGTQSCLDFFSLPAGDIFMYTKYNDPNRLHARPVLRVNTTSDVVELLFQGMEKIATGIRPLVSKGMLTVEKTLNEEKAKSSEATR